MDGVIVDFDSGVNRLNTKTLAQYVGKYKNAPGVFALMDPMPGAIDAINRLAYKFDVYILSTAPSSSLAKTCSILCSVSNWRISSLSRR